MSKFNNQTMQKGLKHATKLLIICCALFINYCFSQSSNSEYFFLDKIIEKTISETDSVYVLSKTQSAEHTFLKKYYNYRYKNKPLYYSFEEDSLTKEIKIDSLSLKKNSKNWKDKYRVLDSLFSKRDFEKIIQLKNSKWDTTNNYFNNKSNLKFNWCNYYCENAISKPFFNEEKKYAFVLHTTKNHNTTIYIFRRKENKWHIYSIIHNAGE